jgi:hypothetical protein
MGMGLYQPYPYPYGFLTGYRNPTRTPTHDTHDKNPHGLPIPAHITTLYTRSSTTANIYGLISWQGQPLPGHGRMALYHEHNVLVAQPEGCCTYSR